jgi:2-alkyl-3-oxoalkanoate reductase
MHLESAVRSAPGIEGVVLRYAGFYGPGNAIGEGGVVVNEVRRRRFPIIGGGAGIWSFLHTEDAAGATLAAVEGGAPGIYNIADDDPAPVCDWLPELARIVGAKPPLRIPAWMGRLIIGEHGVVMMTDTRGASNQKAKRELGWRPVWPTWRDGFRNGLSETAPANRTFERQGLAS